jgi:apolipoprotein N-acyltransferase
MRRRNRVPGPRRKVARTRGVASGFLLLVLGVWGALIPFVGPYFNFSYTPDKAWTWTAARGWLEVLPGAATFLGGLLLIVSASRLVTLTGAWLAIAGGAWFAVGPPLATPLHIGSPGQPAGTGSGIRALESLALFSGLGVVIVFLAATAFGRLSLISPRDVRAAEHREQAAAEQRAKQEALASDEAARQRATADERVAADEQPSPTPAHAVDEPVVAPQQDATRTHDSSRS